MDKQNCDASLQWNTTQQQQDWTTDTLTNMDESIYYAERKKPNMKKYMLYHSLYGNLENAS